MRNLPVVPFCRSLRNLPRRANQMHSFARPAPDKEGRFAVVTRCRRGMRWPRRHQLTSDAEADGEGVWSWSPDAGIKSGVTSPGRRGLKSPVPRGEPAISRNTIAQGVPVVSAALWFLACAKVHFFCTQGSRVRPASGIPCALFSRGPTLLQNSRANRAARTLSHVSSLRGA